MILNQMQALVFAPEPLLVRKGPHPLSLSGIFFLLNTLREVNIGVFHDSESNATLVFAPEPLISEENTTLISYAINLPPQFEVIYKMPKN